MLRLDHASILTPSLEEAVEFYTDLIGLAHRITEADPGRPERRRAMLQDGEKRDVLELIEEPDLAHPSIPGRGGLHHLGFRFEEKAWHTLRGRLDAAGVQYELRRDDCLFVRDTDGMVLEIERSDADQES